MKNKKAYYPATVLFAVFILVFGIWDLFTPVQNYSEMENRYLKLMPKFTLEGLFDNSFSQDYETFMNDQFVLRDQWINLKSRTEAMLLKTENNDIVYGEGDQMFEKYIQVNREQLEKNIGFLQEFLSGRDNVTVGVIPSGYELMRDQLPLGLQQVDQKVEMDKIQAQLGDRATWLPAYESLQTGIGKLYYYTDHHWTIDGAYLIYRAFCEQQGITPADPTAFTRKEVPGFYGTYYSKSKKASAKPEELVYYELPLSEVIVDGEEKDSWLDAPLLEKRDKYGAFLYGNQGQIVLKSGTRPEPEGEPSRLLLIKDSFSNALAPLFTTMYDEVYVIDLRSFPKGMVELMETTEFTDVLVLYNFMNLANDNNFYRLKY